MNSDRPSFDDMRVEVVGAEVRLVFMADTEAHAHKIAKMVAAKIKAARCELDDVEEANGAPN